MSITLDDDFDYTIDERRDAEDDGPALRPGYAPPPSLGEGTATFGAETADNDSEPFLTLRDRSRSTIDWNRFIRPATPEEIKAYDEWEAQRAKQGMGAVISQVFQDRRQAWEQTPDQAAHRMWLERQTGIPQRMMKDGDMLRTAEMRAQMGMDALTLHDAPEQVVSWLKTPGMLEIARDDLETLKKVGDALQQLAASKAPTRPGDKWKDFRSGIADALGGKADVREMQAAALMSPSVLEPEGDVGTSSGVMGLGRGFLASLPKEVRKDVAASMSRAALSNADEWRSWAEWVRPDPYVLPKEGTFSRWLSDVVRGTPYTLTGMPVSAALTTGGAVLGGPLGATAGAALSSLIQTNGEAQLEQAHVWRELVDRGMDPAEAYDKSFNEVYLPNFGLLYLSNFLQDRLTFGVPMGRGAAYWVKRGGNLLLSSLFEGGEEIGQSLISNRALGEENDWGQLLYEGAVGVGVGLVFSGGGTALDTAMGRYREYRAEAGEARESTRIGAVMDEAVKAAEASRVRERSPEAFDDFVEYVGGQGQEKVNVDGAVFFQTFGEDAYAAAERLGIGDGLDEAARTGGAVEIPTAAILKNPDIYEKVKNDLRYSDDGMSRNEAQEYERTRDERNRADIDAAASAMRTVQEAGEKAERIRDGLRSQFEALGHKKVGKREAEFYSTIWTAALANEARYAGVDIEEMARRPEWNLRFQYDRGTGDISRMRDVYTHPVNAGVDLGQKVPILDLSGKIPDAQQVTPQELLDFLKAEFVGKEPSISADGEAMIGLPSNSAAKHVVRSSWKGLTYEDMDTRTAGLMSLRDVLQNATLVESSPNQKSSKTHLKNIHRFYIPVWSSDGLKTLRIVAHESKNSDGRTPVEVDLNDLIVERQNESPARLSGTPLSGVLPERQLRGASEVTIADMLRGVKDAEGRPYVGEEYRQSGQRSLFGEDGEPTLGALPQQRHFLDRLSEKPVEQWSLDEIVAFEEFEDKFNTNKPSTWGASEEDTKRIKKLRAKEEEMELLDGYEFEYNAPSTWDGTDPETRQRASAIMAKGKDMTPQEYDEFRELQTAAKDTYRRDFRRKHIDPDGLLDLYDPQKLEELLYKVSQKAQGEDLTLEDEVTSRGQFQRESPDTGDWVEYPIFIKKRKGERVFEVQDETGKVYAQFDNEIRARYFAQAVALKLDEARETLRTNDDFIPPSQAALDAFDKDDPTTWEDEQLQLQGMELLSKQEEADNAEDDSASEKYHSMFSRVAEDAEALLIDRVDQEQEAHEDDLENNPFRGLDIATIIAGVDAEPYRQASKPSPGAEVYNQTAYNGSPRQSEDYDYSDPKTWPEGPGRDEALMLEAWQNFEPDGEIETWPESPEKTEALALREEYGEIETWIENLPREEFDRMLWSDDPEFVRKNERGEEIENRLRVLARRLRKKKPKGAEGRLLQLIEAEEEAAAREAETYYQSAYHGSPRQSEDYDPSDPKTWPEGPGRDEALDLLSEIEVLRMGAMHPNTWQDTRRAREALEIVRRKNRLMSVERDPRTWMEGARKDDALTYRETLDEDGEVELDPNTWMEESPSKQEALEAWGQYTELGEVLTQKQGLGEPLPQKSIDAYNKVDELLWMLRAQEQERVGERLEDLREEEFNAVDEEMDRLDNRYSDLEDKESRAMLASAEPLQDRLEALISAEEESAAREAETYYQHQAEVKLAQDEKAWATLIDRFLDNELSGKEKGAPLPVMTTPLVLSLTGVEVLPVEIHARNLDKILNGKHEIAPETLKQLPRAIADPIMIFRSPADESKGRDSRVILTELTEKDAGGEDRSIVAAITLKRANTRHGYEINELTTVFRKDVSSRQNLTPELDVLDWMTRRHKDGSPMNLLLYLNRNKGLEWLDHTGTSPKASSLFQDPYVQSVPNEADLDNLRGTAPGFYQDADMPLGSTRFEDAKTIVSILKDGNRSTFLHELGHVFLNSRRNLALMEGIDETVRQDWTTLVEWLEVADIDFSKPLSETDEKRWRNAHEKFAAGFEKYLMEGRAPNLDLARAFRAFRKWLTDIYRAVRNVFYVDADGNRVEFEINDEIRGVMDRMLASEEEIVQATEARQLGEARKKLLEAGIPDDFVKEYEEAVWAATDASECQLFKILEEETSKDYRDRMKELRAQRTTEAREETAKIPRYRTAEFMKEKGIKLSLKDLTDRYGLAVTQDLPKGTAHARGLQLDVAAGMLGYGNADLLVEDLKAVQEVPFNEAVRRAVDESMRREESLLYNPEALRNAADEALHVDERLAEILRRRELVMEKLGRTPRDEAVRRREGAATLAAVKEQAREIVQEKKIGSAASVRKWHAAELRSRSRAIQALEQARKALDAEDTPKASAALKDARRHLDMEALNHALVQEAMKARDEIEAGKRYARRLWKNRKRLEAAVGEENWAQIRGLMERFGFWRVENPEKSRSKAPLAEWTDKLEVGGALLPDLVLQDGVGFDSPALMTFSQFSDLIQAVRTIEHVGRNERTLIIDGRRRERQALKERLIAEKVEHYGDLPPMDTDPNEGSGRLAGAKRLFLKYFSDLTAVEFMMRQMDKHKPLGSWWEAIFKPVSDAELREIEMKREMVSKVRELFARFPDAGAGLKEKVVTRLYNPRKSDYTPFTRENLLALALNMGTERNRQRVLGGWFPKLDMTDERAVQEAMGIVDSLLENLTDTDWEFVQGVWDLFDGYWPQVAALEKEVSGVTPEKERAVPVRTASGKVMRGGYFPIRYNPVKNLTAAKHQAEKLEKSLHETPYGRAAVAHGYTKGRMEVVNRQILFKLDTIAMHLNEVAHDLTHRMAVRDVSRLINDKELSAHLEHVLGRENYEQLNPWLQHIANSALSEKDVTAVDKMVRRGMSNIAAAYMGFKVSVGLKQIVGLGPAADQVGRLRLSKAMMQYLAAYDKEAIRDEIFAKSTYMSDRANNFDRDIRGALSERTASTFSNREAGVRNMMFWWAGYMDTLVSIPTWLAAYHKALNDFAKETQDSTALEAKAVEYADMVVRTTQNAGSPKDLAAIQRGGAMRKLFTMFYTGIGRLYNLTREEWHKGHGIRDIPRLTGHVLTVYTIPFLVGELLMNRAFGSGDDDDDSLLARLWWAGKGTLGEMMAPLVFVRDVANLFVTDYRYRATPLDEIGGSIERLVRMSRRSMDEDKEMDWTKFAKESTNAAGGLLGLPSRQIIATIRGIDNAIDKWDERGPWERLFGTPMDILMGPVKEKR